MKKKATKIIVSALLSCLIISIFPCFASADEIMVTSHFTTSTGKAYDIAFPYSDEFFSLDENEYHHELAKISIGLTTASYRKGTYTYARTFLEGAGFENINTEPYDTLPTTDSIANCIGSKKIDDFTLIAVGVCGGDYGKEWASNFTVGNSERSEGFNDAAQQVIQRIKKYIDDNAITGKKVLWVTGQSRAGATSNIVAADMTDSGLFERVYGYTFGTPRTTRDKGEYTNIFNIMSKDDVVPKVPLPDWGYERYGTDLYLKAQEYDSDYPEAGYKAYLAVDDMDFHANTELNDDYRTIFGYLYEFVPDAATYEATLQNKLREIVASGEKSEIIPILKEIAGEFKPKDEQQEKELRSFLEFLDKLAGKYVLYGNREEIKKGDWIKGGNVVGNLMPEHIVTKYLQWMLSSEDGEGLYSENQEFIKLTINTSADVLVFSENGYIQTIKTDGDAEYSCDGYTSEDRYIAYSRNKNQVQIDIPQDEPYTIVFTPKTKESADMVAVKYNEDSVAAKLVCTAELSENADVARVIYSPGNGTLELVMDSRFVNVSGNSIEIPMSVITELEDINVFHLSLYDFIYTSIICVGLLLAEVIVHIFASVYRKSRNRERSQKSEVIVYVLNVLLLMAFILEIWFYAPSVPYICELAELICFCVILAYASKGESKLHLIPMVVVMVALLLFCHFYTGAISTKGIILTILVMQALAAYGHFVRKKSTKKDANQEKEEQ